MDVTLFEDKPYYSTTYIHMEKFEEYQFLDYLTLYPSDPILMQHESIFNPIWILSEMDTNNLNLNTPTPPNDGTLNKDAKQNTT